MVSIRRALGFSFASQYFVQIVSFASVVVVSRLLTPSEIGIYSVAAVVLFVAGYLRTFGITQYIVREVDLTKQKLRTALAAVIIMSWGIGALLAVSAPQFAAFYGEPGLATIFRVLAFTFLFSPFISVPFSYFMREMAFDKTMWVASVGAVVQAVVTVSLAYLGYSYMSMAWGLLCGALAELVVVSVLRMPGTQYIPSFRGLLVVFKFGTFAAASGMLEKLSEGIPDLVLGRVSTMQDVGIYSRGLGVVLIFNRAVTLAVRPIILPHFSSEFREGRSVARAYTGATEWQTGLAWPFFAAFSAAALPIIRVLYGDQWDAAVPIAELLAVWGASSAFVCFSADALVAAGKVQLVFVKEALLFVLRAVAIVYAASFGLDGVTTAVVLLGLVEVAVVVVILKRGIGLSVRQLLFACRRSASMGVVTFVVCHGAAPLVYSFLASEVLQLMVFIALGAISWGAMVVLTKHPLLQELQRHFNRVRVALGNNRQ